MPISAGFGYTRSSQSSTTIIGQSVQGLVTLVSSHVAFAAHAIGSNGVLCVAGRLTSYFGSIQCCQAASLLKVMSPLAGQEPKTHI